MKKKDKKLIWILIVLTVAMVVIPIIALRGAEFGGSDDAGSEMISEITGEEYEPWFTPVLERFLGGELPGEMESLLFCLQTAIGVGVIFFFVGKFTEKKKWTDRVAELEAKVQNG